MDSNRIKRLATGVREALRNEVSARLDAVLAEGSRESLEVPSQVWAIQKDVQTHGRDEVVDRAAYTWFNRLCALRFMDANGYTPTPVVTPRVGATQPAVLADARQGVFDSEYGISQGTRERVMGLLAGSVTSVNAAEDAYALLLGAVCEHYSGPMGYLFAEDVASLLLMPQGLLAQGSILAKIVSEMDEDACSDVEVLGWLYQFYIAERKDEYFASKKKATAMDIPAATQLFTPRWIVAYLVENSLGRFWMLNNPDSELAASMDYYIAPEGDEPHVEVSSTDEIRVLDPACGSGHILVYAFDLLFQMYAEEGWPTEDIPEMILRNNLFGLEIDRRAAEIASFALEMKARERDSRFFERDVDANIHVLEPIELLPQELELVPQLAERRGLLEAMSHLDEVGSLYVPDSLDEFVLTNELEHVEHDGSLFAESVIVKLKAMLINVQALSQSFHCVVANPPYMSSASYNKWMSDWMRGHYPAEKSDLCVAFIKRNLSLACKNGFTSMITMQSWMSLPTYEAFRVEITEKVTVATMAHLGTRAFDTIGGEVVSTVAFALMIERCDCQGLFLDLTSFGSSSEKEDVLKRVANEEAPVALYRRETSSFRDLPGCIFAYWLPGPAIDAFKGPLLGEQVDAKTGVTTGDNTVFLRYWHEVNKASILSKWYPLDKGGDYRKWYGNNEYVINWEDDGRAIREYEGSTIRNSEFYFRESVTWSKIASHLNARYSGSKRMFDAVGLNCFGNDSYQLDYLLGYLCSSTADYFARAINQSLSITVGTVNALPLRLDVALSGEVSALVGENVDVAKTDYNSFESSCDFIRHPMTYIPDGTPERLSNCYARWETECRERFDRLKSNEEELNRIFARIYNMEGEVSIEVPDDRVSARLADRARDARSLVSYIVGCIFGRYSWECGALAIANQGDTVEDYCSWSRVAGEGLFFVPDGDNVLPVLSDVWFDDDLVAGIRRWLAHAYGEETDDENVTWIEESLGKDLRAYLVRDFYADHLKVYQKRPIYWMFQSPKKSFQCLVYMHRYDEGTVGTILTGYLRPLEDKLRARLQVLESSGARASDVREANRVRGMIAELEQWEREVIYPLAHERVSIDLDDGVKVNYNKFPRALAKVPGLSDWK